MLIHSGIAYMLQKKLYRSLSTWMYIFLMNVQVNWHHVWQFCSLWIKHCVYMLHVGVMVIYPYTTLLAYLYFTHKPETVSSHEFKVFCKAINMMYLGSVHVLRGMFQILVTHTWRSESILVIAFLYFLTDLWYVGWAVYKHTSFMLSWKQNSCFFLLWIAAVQL